MSLPFKYDVTGRNWVVTTRNNKSTVTGTNFIFQGDTQPVSSREILALTEGRISSGMIRVFSESALVVSTEGDSTKGKGTYVLFEGKWYEVAREASWNSKIPELKSINHYEYTAEYRCLEGDVA
jgi:hypothetical protein